MNNVIEKSRLMESNIKIGELTETALLEYMENNPLNSQEKKLYDLELEKRQEQKKK